MNKQLKFDNRELNEIQHAIYYAENLSHGTVGHNMLMLIAKLAKLQGFYMTGGQLFFSDGLTHWGAYEHFESVEQVP